jgi:hypothetical protein
MSFWEILDPGQGAPGRARVLMLTTFDADQYIYEALRCRTAPSAIRQKTGVRSDFYRWRG